MNDITEPLVLAAGSHVAGEGRGCAMNVISWENGDVEITDYPSCSDRLLSQLVQKLNDSLQNPFTGLLSAENSIIALGFAHQTVGTSDHGLTDGALWAVYADCIRAAVEIMAPHFPADLRDELRERYLLYADAMPDPTWYDDTPAFIAYWAIADAFSDVSLFDYRRPQILAKVVGAAIARFKELTGAASPQIDPQVTADAVAKMRVCA